LDSLALYHWSATIRFIGFGSGLRGDCRKAGEAAGAAIIGCIEIINEHDVNKECGAYNPGVFIQLEPHQEMGLHYAIETCSRDIARIFDEHLEKIGVNWLDETCPKVTEEAQAFAKMRSGEITFAEYQKRVDGEDPLQSASSH